MLAKLHVMSATAAVCATSIALLFQDIVRTAITKGDASDTVFMVERITLEGALVVAVAVLWKSKGETDKNLALITREMVSALSFNIDTQKELRKIVEESTTAKQLLTQAIENLKTGMERFPCQLEVEKHKH